MITPHGLRNDDQVECVLGLDAKRVTRLGLPLGHREYARRDGLGDEARRVTTRPNSSGEELRQNRDAARDVEARGRRILERQGEPVSANTRNGSPTTRPRATHPTGDCTPVFSCFLRA